MVLKTLIIPFYFIGCFCVMLYTVKQYSLTNERRRERHGNKKSKHKNAKNDRRRNYSYG